MAINLIGLQRRRQCMRYVVCVCHACVLAVGLTGWPDGGRAAACMPPPAIHRAGQGWIFDGGRGETQRYIYAIYTSNYARGKIYAKRRAPFYH